MAGSGAIIVDGVLEVSPDWLTDSERVPQVIGVFPVFILPREGLVWPGAAIQPKGSHRAGLALSTKRLASLCPARLWCPVPQAWTLVQSAVARLSTICGTRIFLWIVLLGSDVFRREL